MALDRQTYAIEYLKKKGWSTEQAAGLVANFIQEAGVNLNTAAIGDSGNSHGLAQWNGARRTNAETFIGKPLGEASLEQQLDFVDYELRNQESPAGDRLAKANTYEDAVRTVRQYYERPANKTGEEDTWRISKGAAAYQSSLKGGAAGNAGAMGAVGQAGLSSASPTASGTDALSVSRQSLQQVQQLLAGGLPQADYEAASASSLNALRGNLNNTRAALDVGQRRLEEQAAMGNQQTQMLLDRYNQDPAKANSRSSRNAQMISDLQEGLEKTILAKRQRAGANLFNDPAGFMENLLLGNPYARGQKDIEAELDLLTKSNTNMTSTINNQRGLLTAATATPSSVITQGMQNQLALAGLEKDVGLAEADAPVKISEAKTNALLAQLGAVREVASSATSLANVEQNATQTAEYNSPENKQLRALETEARTNKLQQAIKIDKILEQNPDLDPALLAQLQQQSAILKEEALVKGLKVEQTGNVAGNVAAANVSNARAGAVQAKSAEELAALNAQTAGQAAVANYINSGTSVKQAGADAANFDAKQSLDAQALSIQTMQQQMKTMDTAAQLQAAPELVRLQTQYARDKAVFDANQQKEQLAQQDAANRVASKQLTAAEGGLDQTAKASNKVQQAYLAAGGTGQLIEAQLSDGVKANLAKVADGQPAGANPVAAKEVLDAAGLLKSNVKYPELEATATKAQTLTQLYMEGAGMKIDEKTIKSVDGGQVATYAKANSYAGRDVTTFNLRAKDANLYAAPDHHKLMAWATANGKLTDDVPAMRIAMLPAESAFDKASTLDQMAVTLMDSGMNVADASTAIASYFSLAIEYNNANNGYKLLGLKESGKEDFAMQGTTVKRYNGKQVTNLTDPASIASQIYQSSPLKSAGANIFNP